MIRDGEDFDIALPNSPAQKRFMNMNGFHVFGRTLVKFLNDTLKRRNVSGVWGGVLVRR
jgi:hypothetical protein